MLFVKKEGKYIDFFENSGHYKNSKRGQALETQGVVLESHTYTTSCQLIKQQPQFKKLIEDVTFGKSPAILQVKNEDSFILKGSDYEIKIHSYDKETQLYNCIFNKKRNFWTKNQILTRLNGYYLLKYLHEPYHLNHIKKYVGSSIGKSWVIFKYEEEAKREECVALCQFCGKHKRIDMQDIKEKKAIADCSCVKQWVIAKRQSRFMSDFSFLELNKSLKTDEGTLVIQKKCVYESNIFSVQYECLLNNEPKKLTVLAIMQLLNVHTEQAESIFNQKTFDKLTPVKVVGYLNNKFDNPIFECHCECGAVTHNTYVDLTKHNVKCCAKCKIKSYHKTEVSNKIDYFKRKYVDKTIV